MLFELVMFFLMFYRCLRVFGIKVNKLDRKLLTGRLEAEHKIFGQKLSLLPGQINQI